MNNTYTTAVEVDDDGEYVITFPQEVLNEVGWEVGTTIQWIDNMDGSFTLEKVTTHD